MLLSTASPASFVPVPGLPDAVVAGFTRRLDLACSDRQPDDQAVTSWGQVLQLAGIHDVALVSQVHGDGLLEAHAPTGALRTLGEADAVWTRVPGLAVAVRVADCVPVLLHGAGFVAAIHAGWRGVAARIVPKTIATLSVECEVDPSEMHAVLGPAICGRHYEVGPEVVTALEDAGIPAAHFVVPGRGERAHVDGSCAVAWQLARAGVRDVTQQRACTWEDPALHSWRRDGPRAGRIVGLIALRGA